MIELFHVTKTYPGGQKPALKDVSFRVEKGEFVFITGPSGAGKTTLLRLIFGAERTSNGQVLVAGRNMNRVPLKQVAMLRRNVGVVFQDFKLLNNRTALENVAFALEVVGTPRREIKRRAWMSLKHVHLHDKMEKFPLSLSGGEQQRIAIARALINNPILLLADEPTGSLDPDITEEIMRLFEEVNMKGTTVIVASHDRELIRSMGKRVIRLQQGIFEGEGI